MYSHLLLALAGVSQVTASAAALEAINAIYLPKLSSEFSKNNVSAQWAPGYPKEWGAEDFNVQFSEPEPDDFFGASVTSDEKYLVMINGTHVTFYDLNTKTTVSTFGWTLPESQWASSLTLRTVPQGGYDVLVNVIPRRYFTPTTSLQQRVSANLTRVGEQRSYNGGIGTISQQGKLATLNGYIYDLDSANGTTVAVIDGQPDLTDLSFSPDGNKLASVSWHEETADLWNATSGQKIHEFTPTKAQNWVTRISPDGKHVAMGLGSGKNYVQLYTLSNYTLTEIKGFKDWPRQMQWSDDNKYLAVGDRARVRIWKMPELEVVQTWEADGNDDPLGLSMYDLTWLEGSEKISFMYRDTRYVYDLEENTKWVTKARVLDHIWGDEHAAFIKSKGLLATVNGDSTVRFWKV